ncbi:FtsH-binding integral membrane protein [Brevundimonas variabilis]|uniref:FtsH-binding integral membrane protein n=1 Tax=Brevundimonas variabilis TaxID=74312 RepID=A0A7W9FFE0_9CAUL|nr:hypothetical protein [Brevundimonas variabilis]MBB5747371.1 FtsH-binding integral membrane protein [Brevundimonas variabilis]
MNQSRPRRPFGLRAYAGTMLATVVVAAIAGAGSAIFGEGSGWAAVGINAAFFTVAMAAGMTACVWWWRGIDEAAREAHKVAWWWGGSGGMAVGGVILLSVVLPDEGAALLEGLSGPDLFAAGMGAVAGCQVLGYTIAWAVWWLRHR